MNGVYRLTYNTQQGNGTGSVILKDGLLHGGDGEVAYVGTYTTADSKLNASFKAMKHGSFSFLPNGATVAISGATVQGAQVTGTASVPGVGATFQFILHKVAEL